MHSLLVFVTAGLLAMLEATSPAHCMEDASVLVLRMKLLSLQKLRL